jgi:hypothetical protein
MRQLPRALQSRRVAKRRSAVERPVQPLGQLFATDVSDTLARHRRKFRHQHRSPDDRSIRSAGHNATGQRHARCQRCCPPGLLCRCSRGPRFLVVINREYLASRAETRSTSRLKFRGTPRRVQKTRFSRFGMLRRPKWQWCCATRSRRI